jgi:hypothetical protein
VIVAGSETVVPAPDASRPDAGKTVRRRFTEVGVRRDGIVLAPDDGGRVIDQSAFQPAALRAAV